MMNFSGEQRIFRREYNGKTYYSTGISKKDMNTNTYTSEYIPVVFKKGVDIPNKTDIIVKSASLTWDKYQKEGEKKSTIIWKLFIFDYQLKQNDDNFEGEFKDFDSSNDDLPF